MTGPFRGPGRSARLRPGFGGDWGGVGSGEAAHVRPVTRDVEGAGGVRRGRGVEDVVGVDGERTVSLDRDQVAVAVTGGLAGGELLDGAPVAAPDPPRLGRERHTVLVDEAAVVVAEELAVRVHTDDVGVAVVVHVGERELLHAGPVARDVPGLR